MHSASHSSLVAPDRIKNERNFACLDVSNRFETCLINGSVCRTLVIPAKIISYVDSSRDEVVDTVVVFSVVVSGAAVVPRVPCAHIPLHPQHVNGHVAFAIAPTTGSSHMICIHVSAQSGFVSAPHAGVVVVAVAVVGDGEVCVVRVAVVLDVKVEVFVVAVVEVTEAMVVVVPLVDVLVTLDVVGVVAVTVVVVLLTVGFDVEVIDVIVRVVLDEEVVLVEVSDVLVEVVGAVGHPLHPQHMIGQVAFTKSPTTRFAQR